MGSIPPGVFIPLAEQTGLIIPLGERIMNDACHFARLWNDGSRNPVRFSVNLSPRQIMLDDFLPLMKGCISRRGLPAGMGGAGNHREHADVRSTTDQRLMMRAFALGVAVSIDDFRNRAIRPSAA